MGVSDRILGHPFVYNKVRPFVVGGIDMSAAYDQLGNDSRSVVLDVGCGTGATLDHIKTFDSYLGIDIDPGAIRFARERHGRTPNVTFQCSMCRDEDVSKLAPSHVVMAGLLHHLDDKMMIDLLQVVGRSPRLVRIITMDIVFLPGAYVNNFFARLDRGKFCRTEQQYHDLVSRAGMRRTGVTIMKSHPKSDLVKYLVMILEPKPQEPVVGTPPPSP